MERELSHNIPCSPQGGKLSGRGKTILGGIYIHDYCISFVHATREFGARGRGTMLPVPVAHALRL